MIALRQLAQRGKAVGAELVKDAGDEFGEFFVLAVAVDGEGVGGDGGVDCMRGGLACSHAETKEAGMPEGTGGQVFPIAVSSLSTRRLRFCMNQGK